MDSNKAKKAKSKARTHARNQQENQIAAAQMTQLAQSTGPNFINPEVQAPDIAMQNMTQTVNPYHMMGTLPPNAYRYGNMIDGYQGVYPEFAPLG